MSEKKTNKRHKDNYIKTKISNTQQKTQYRLYRVKGETVNHIKSECRKLVQKVCKTRHDWMGKVIHLELSKKLKFDYSNKWYMHKPESVKENGTQTILGDFEIKTDHQISARRKPAD